MKRALIIVGPTAVGKTDFAFSLSRAFPSVLISADSIQVYRGADIISGEDNSLPTFLLDVVAPDQEFSVRDFVERVRPIVHQAFKEDKIPITVGGTGFYIDALFGKIDTINVPPDLELREKLKNFSVEQLQNKLSEHNSVRFQKMNKSDANNKRRLIRAIEVVGSKNMKSKPVLNENEVLMIGLKTSMEHLKKRIAVRVEKRLESGALAEAQRLFKKYEKLSPQIKSAAGYKQLFDFLANRTPFQEAVRTWIIAERQLAKNQMTYLRRNKNIIWFDIKRRGFEQEILRLVTHELSLSTSAPI